MSGIAIMILLFLTPCINFAVMLITMPRRWRLGYTLLAFAAVLLLVRFPISTLIANIDIDTSYRRMLSSFVYLPFLLVLFRGQLFQKIFSFFMQLVFSAFQLQLVSGIAEILFPLESDSYYLFRLIATLVVFGGYITLVYFYGRRFCKRLFIDERPAAWGLYSFGAALSSITVIATADIDKPIIYFLVLFFAVWSFCTLCFAIINTHEKTKQKADAEFAREVISSGREHYQKMNDMYDALGTLRHDYKYHMNTIAELTQSGDMNAIKEYLIDIEAQILENELHLYCSNSVINAVLNSYAERFAKLDAKFSVSLSMPDTISIPNYEMCIILGNLLENAREACEKIERGREIELSVKKQGDLLAVLVRNSYNGVVNEADGQPVSAKKDGGFGLRSIKAVAERYGGHILAQWDDISFSVYVMLKM